MGTKTPILTSILLLIIGIFIMPAFVLAEDTLHLIYTIRKNNDSEQPRVEIHYTLHKDWTKVEHPNHLFMLNYKAGHVLRKGASGTTQFKLNSANHPQQELANAKLRVGSYKISPTKDKQTIDGLPALKKIIRFGYELDRFRTRGPVQHNAFGEVFSARTVSVWVSDQHEFYQKLRTLTQTRQEALDASPLLAQLDITTLVPQLGGVPLRIEEQKGQGRRILELIAINPLR